MKIRDVLRTQARKLLVIVEHTATGFSAYSPDVPGCIATGGSRADVEASMREAIAFHLDGLREDGATRGEG